MPGLYLLFLALSPGDFLTPGFLFGVFFWAGVEELEVEGAEGPPGPRAGTGGRLFLLSSSWFTEGAEGTEGARKPELPLLLLLLDISSTTKFSELLTGMKIHHHYHHNFSYWSLQSFSQRILKTFLSLFLKGLYLIMSDNEKRYI